MENVCLCGRATKYQCIRCETTVCVLCAPEIQNPEYKNKAKAAREFKARYKFEVKASKYNPWMNQ